MKNRKNRKNATAMAVISLALCVALSASLLFSRLVSYATQDVYQSIPLTQSAGITTVLTGRMDENGGIHFSESARFDPRTPVVLSYSPFLTADWFQVTDENTIWQGETDIEIFRLNYENGEGNVTVQSGNGDKLVAPGTANTYRFQLENTGDHAVKYEMSMEAWFSHEDKQIPVNARVYDKYGEYYAGTETEMVDVLALNSVSDSGTLKAGYRMPYTLEWEWPFEEDDAYDTWLGNSAVDEDITLTIVINTLASYTPEPNVSDGDAPPKTGDQMLLWASGAMAVSGVALLILLLPLRRKEEEENG